MTTAGDRGLREGSPRKRGAILAAARELFIADGFDRTKMDEIASRAGVSKRTVYDYYGDKRTLLLAVVDEALSALRSSVHRAIEEFLVDLQDVEAALIGFARAVTTSALGSSDYVALMRLLSMQSAELPELHDGRWSGAEPQVAVAKCFTALHRQGLLEAPDPRLAAEHFVALTVLPIATRPARAPGPDPTATDQMIVDGVRAFLRAYGPSAGARQRPA